MLNMLETAAACPGCVSAWSGLIVHGGLKDRERELENAKRDAFLQVESLVAQQKEIEAGTRQVLSTLARLPQVQALDAQACSRLFHELKDQNSIYSGIGASTPEGNMFANARNFEPGSVNVSEQKHIRDAIRSLGFSVGEYTLGRVSNVPAIYYAYPVLDVDKRLISIVTAGSSLSEYDSFIEKANLPSDSAVVILDHQERRLYRFPQDERAPIGERPTSGFDHIRGLGAGTYERMSDDGVNRLFAYKRVSLKENSTPHLLIAVGIPKDRIIHKANVAMLYYLLLLTLATFGAMSLGGLLGYSSLVRPIDQLVSAARRLGSGAMDTRTDLPHTHDELGTLAKSFDDMAEMLERRNIETQNAVSALREAEERYRTLSEATFEGVAFTEKGLLTDANS